MVMSIVEAVHTCMTGDHGAVRARKRSNFIHKERYTTVTDLGVMNNFAVQENYEMTWDLHTIMVEAIEKREENKPVVFSCSLSQ